MRNKKPDGSTTCRVNMETRPTFLRRVHRPAHLRRYASNNTNRRAGGVAAARCANVRADTSGTAGARRGLGAGRLQRQRDRGSEARGWRRAASVACAQTQVKENVAPMAPSKSMASGSPQGSPGLLAAAMLSGATGGIGEIFDCLPVPGAAACAQGPAACAAGAQPAPQLSGKRRRTRLPPCRTPSGCPPPAARHPRLPPTCAQTWIRACLGWSADAPAACHPPTVTRTAAADIHGRVRGARCRRNSRRPDCRVTAARQQRARSQQGSAVYRIASPLRIRLAPRVATATGGRVGGGSKEAGEAGALRHALGGDSSVSEYPLRRNAPCGARAASTRVGVRGNSAT